jgi:GT2 family glycosyltransferase
LPIIRLPQSARFRRADPHRWRGARTCNLAAWHADVKRVNGFDESYEGWGLEDSDLAIRLRHAGVNRKSAQFWAPVFHLWHSEHDRALLSENQRRLDELVASRRDRALRGLEEHLRVLGTQR